MNSAIELNGLATNERRSPFMECLDCFLSEENLRNISNFSLNSCSEILPPLRLGGGFRPQPKNGRGKIHFIQNGKKLSCAELLKNKSKCQKAGTTTVQRFPLICNKTIYPTIFLIRMQPGRLAPP